MPKRLLFHFLFKLTLASSRLIFSQRTLDFFCEKIVNLHIFEEIARDNVRRKLEDEIFTTTYHYANNVFVVGLVAFLLNKVYFMR